MQATKPARPLWTKGWRHANLANMNTKHPLAEWRRANDLSQGEFAIRVGVTKWTISMIEGRKRQPSLDLVKRVVAETNGAVRADDFLGELELSR